MEKITVANEVLATFASCQISQRKNGVFVSFRYCGKDIVRRWQCRGQDFYPVWHRIYPGGGTSSTALSQLVRWVQDKPVLPLSTWQWWAGDKCKLLKPEAVERLREGGYPVHVPCVLCHKTIQGGLDWWSLDKVSGPCCAWTSGCRQRGAA